MGLPAESPVAQISAQVVGNVFLEQYYKILHGSPQSFYKFYQDSSVLSRQDSYGIITSVTTTQAINKLILSLNCEKCMTEILSADSQQSYNGGVLIQVIGYLIKLDDKTKRKFSQSFFLAPQICGGYFVLNDVFVFVDDNEQDQSTQPELYDIGQKNGCLAVNETEANATMEQPVQAELDESMSCKRNIAEEVPPPTESEVTTSTADSTSETTDSSRGICTSETTDSSRDNCSVFVRNLPLFSTAPQVEEALKKFGPIKQGGLQVRSHKLNYHCFAFVEFESLESRQAAIKASPVMIRGRPAFITEKKAIPRAFEGNTTEEVPPPTESEITASSGDSTSETNESSKDSCSVFIRNLPLFTTAPQVEEALKKFGPIKQGGLQVRNHKLNRYCYAFVEFESLESRQAAIKASPVMIRGHQAFITEKRTISRAGKGNPAEEVPPPPDSEITTVTGNCSSETVDSSKDNCSVFVRNLSSSSTANQVEEALKKFGPIKQGGLQVRSNKMNLHCFAFVEFESLESRKAAIEASPVMIGGHQAFITEKRSIPRANDALVSEVSASYLSSSNMRGYNSVCRDGLHNDSNFRDGQGSSRNNYNSGRGRGPPRGRFGGAYYQTRSIQNQCGSSCQNMANQATIAV